MKAKSWYTSKTVWFNVLAGLVAFASFFGFGSFEPNPRVVEGIGSVVAIINIVLRFVTKQPVK